MRHTYLIFFLLLSWMNSISQTITLPSYQEGKYENNTIYNYYGAMPSTGIGSIYFGGLLANGFLSGVHFKVVIDSINQASSENYASVIDSLGTLHPVHKGDTLNLPVSFQLFEGEIGFHIIIEGTPLISGEAYFCYLWFNSSLGNDWGLIVKEQTQHQCLVNPLSVLNESFYNKNSKVYPNPFNQKTTIEFDKNQNETYQFILYDILGKEVKTINDIKSNKIIIEKENLQKGTYIFQIYNKDGIVSTGKLMLNE